MSDMAQRPWYQRTRWIVITLLLVAAVLFVVDHRNHALGYLPWMFLAACPLMHVFMHGRRGHHGRHGADEQQAHANRNHAR